MVAKPSPKKRATYQDLLDAPENMVAEILDGALFLASRPKRRHTNNASALGTVLKGAFELGIQGPGGWRILFEPEVHLGPPGDADVVVPDIAGWRAGRLVDDPDIDEPFIKVVPDWICEVGSPSTSRVDRLKKMPIYAREKVGHVWLPEPSTRTLEVFRFEKGGYILVGHFGGDESIRAEPFADIEIPPHFFWGSVAPAAESAAKPAKKSASRRPKKRGA